MKIYFIYDKFADDIFRTKRGWCYNSLGRAKDAVRKYIRHHNKGRGKPEKIKFERFEIIECEAVEREYHPI